MADVILQAEVIKDSQDYKHLTAVDIPAGRALLISGTLVFVPAPVSPAVLVYSTPDAAGGGTGFEHDSVIPAGAIPNALASVYATLANATEPPTNPTSYWIQVHLGVAPLAAGAIPLLVGDSLVVPGGNEQFIPPAEVDRAAGFTIAPSTTQMTYTDPGAGVLVIRTRAWGR